MKNQRFVVTYGDSILIVFKVTIIIVIVIVCEKNEFLEKNIAALSCFPAEQSNAYRILPSAYNNWTANRIRNKKILLSIRLPFVSIQSAGCPGTTNVRKN